MRRWLLVLCLAPACGSDATPSNQSSDAASATGIDGSEAELHGSGRGRGGNATPEGGVIVSGTGGLSQGGLGGTTATPGGGGTVGQGGVASSGQGGAASPGRGGASPGQGGAASPGQGGAASPGQGGRATGKGGSGATGGTVVNAGGTTAQTSGNSTYWGDSHSGHFWLGPVDYAETVWHNGCAPGTKYPVGIQQLYGNYIMGLSNDVQLQGLSAGAGQLCDSCAELVANGLTLVAHVVTFGEETSVNDIDVSPEIRTALNASTSDNLTWRFVTCPTTDPIHYTFDGGEWTNTWFFRVWVRNARVPVSKVEFKVGSGAWATADWQSDGAWEASSQDFGAGFSLRVTSIDNQTVEDKLPGLNTFDPDVGVASHGNFQ